MIELKLGAGEIIILSGLIAYTLTRLKPPGIAFTYFWLISLALASAIDSTDGLAFAFCLGFGINFSWYTSQLIDLQLWNNMIPYWDSYFPKWCRESMIRLGDIMLHPIPLYFTMQYADYVTFRTFLYAFLYERWYFLIAERQLFGDGNTTNLIYSFSPHLPKRTFLVSQYLTNLGYLFSAVCRIEDPNIRFFLQLTCAGFILFVCLTHTNRVSEQSLCNFPTCLQKIIGLHSREAQTSAEIYTERINKIVSTTLNETFAEPLVISNISTSVSKSLKPLLQSDVRETFYLIFPYSTSIMNKQNKKKVLKDFFSTVYSEAFLRFNKLYFLTWFRHEDLYYFQKVSTGDEKKKEFFCNSFATQ